MRPRLSEKYADEREEICARLLAILELDEKGAFILATIDADAERQNKIMAMKDEIRKCFSCCNMSPFKPSATCKRPYLSVVKNILRKQGYTIVGNDYTTKPDHVKTTRYYVFR
jgi:hypothetical protein